jgi:hypothetical protein
MKNGFGSGRPENLWIRYTAMYNKIFVQYTLPVNKPLVVKKFYSVQYLKKKKFTSGGILAFCSLHRIGLILLVLSCTVYKRGMH